MSGGQRQRGAQGTAGDLGHVRVLRADDVTCRCGNTGCLEAVAAGPAIAAARHRAPPRPASAPGSSAPLRSPSGTCSRPTTSTRVAWRWRRASPTPPGP
ncbi:ROK family protein [Nocardioides psychrotolerans]|uniref:ROK family protein n=1 Tax=Nocardioides psychrotolerans TaxID=1005945 RepID=UPI001FE699C7|nr:ROK family protein [Nocardioides psychrotolerans]